MEFFHTISTEKGHVALQQSFVSAMILIGRWRII